MKFPLQLEDAHFRIVKARGKKPNVESEWQTRNNYHSAGWVANEILSSGLNYGFTCPTGFACFIDADTKEIQDVLDLNAWTFRYSTGTPGHYQYVYFIENNPIGCVPLKDGAYIKGKGGFAVGPGSIHPNGKTYGTDIRYAPIAVVKRENLLLWLSPFHKKEVLESPGLPMPRFTRVTEQQIDSQVQELLDLWIKADGHRHNLTLALVGFYQKREWSYSDIVSLITKLIKLSKKGEEHMHTIKNAYESKGNKWGLPMILEIEKEVTANVH
jgi:hypothetical protein